MARMVRMVVTAEHQYAGHRLPVGKEYDCEEQHVSLMQRMGWARPVAEADTVYESRAVTAEGPEPRAKRGRYSRRDMRAE